MASNLGQHLCALILTLPILTSRSSRGQMAEAGTGVLGMAGGIWGWVNRWLRTCPQKMIGGRTTYEMRLQTWSTCYIFPLKFALRNINSDIKLFQDSDCKALNPKAGVLLRVGPCTTVLVTSPFSHLFVYKIHPDTSDSLILKTPLFKCICFLLPI